MMLQPAGRKSRRKRQPEEEEQGSLDPIALTLAVWLGLMVGVTGFMRLAQEAASDAALVQAGQIGPDKAVVDTSPFNPRLMAFGG